MVIRGDRERGFPYGVIGSGGTHAGWLLGVIENGGTHTGEGVIGDDKERGYPCRVIGSGRAHAGWLLGVVGSGGTHAGVVMVVGCYREQGDLCRVEGVLGRVRRLKSGGDCKLCTVVNH